MKSINPVKMLLALALVLLVFSATEGRILSKCELKEQLDAAQFKQITAMQEKMTVSHLIARLVCKANSSAFNTSFVTAITVNHKEKKPDQRPTLLPPQAPSKKPSKPHAQALTKGPRGSGHETAHPQLNASAVGQLFGVFQLSDQLACDSGVMPSLNACNISCTGEFKALFPPGMKMCDIPVYTWCFNPSLSSTFNHFCPDFFEGRVYGGKSMGFSDLSI